MENLNKIRNEVGKRLDNVKVFYPFFEIYIKNKPEEGIEYDTPVLVLSTLSYLFYEGKLKEKELQYEEIRDYIRLFLFNTYELTLEYSALYSLTQDIIFKLDNRYEYQYLDRETKKIKSYFISLIQINPETMGYFITPDGVDFFLKTLEYQQASSVETLGLVIELQLKNGTFDEAIRTIEIMKKEILAKLGQRSRLMDEMAQNIGNNFEKYREWREGINAQLEREKLQFTNITNIINATSRNRLESHNDIDKEALSAIRRVETDINTVKRLHMRLINEIVEVSGEYDKLIDLKLKSAFKEKFNFEKVIEKGFFEAKDIQALQYTIQPFTHIKLDKQFSLEKIFAPQRLRKADSNQSEESEILEVMEWESVDALAKQRVEANYQVFTALLLKLLHEKETITLTDLMDYIRTNYTHEFVFNRDFVPFIAQLNKINLKSDSYIKVINFAKIMKRPGTILSDIEKYMMAIVQKVDSLKNKKLIIESMPNELIEIDEAIRITQLKFSLSQEGENE